MKLAQTLDVLVMLGDRDAILAMNTSSLLPNSGVITKRDGRLSIVGVRVPVEARDAAPRNVANNM